MCCFANLFKQNVEVFLLSNAVCIYHFYESQLTYLGKKIIVHYSSIAIFYVQTLFYRITCQDRVSTAHTALGTQYASKKLFS